LPYHRFHHPRYGAREYPPSNLTRRHRLPIFQ